MNNDPESPFKRPPLESLPAATASLRDVIRFASAFDPTAHFHARWGDDYKPNVQALWKRCVESYQAGVPASADPDELLLCLSYDCVLGPYLGVPEPHKLPFLIWLIEGIRKSLPKAT